MRILIALATLLAANVYAANYSELPTIEDLEDRYSCVLYEEKDLTSKKSIAKAIICREDLTQEEAEVAVQTCEYEVKANTRRGGWKRLLPSATYTGNTRYKCYMREGLLEVEYLTEKGIRKRDTQIIAAK